jgi:hypothetical protein
VMLPRDEGSKWWKSPEGAFPRYGNFPVLKAVVLEFNPWRGHCIYGKRKRKCNIRSLLFRRCATSTLVMVFDGPRLGALPMQVSPPTGFGILVVLWNKANETVARLVRSGTGRSRVVLCTIDASNHVGALVEGVLSSGGAAIVAGRRRVWAWVRRIIWTYLDGGNGVGKIPPC